MDVDLSGGEQFMAGQVLDLAQVGALLDQPRGKRVAQRVRGDAHIEPGDLSVGLEGALDFAHGKAAVVTIGEEWSVGLGGEPARDEEADQLGDGAPGLGVQRQLAGAVALADVGGEVEPGPGSAQGPGVANVEPGEFGDAKAGVESQPDHGVVTRAEGLLEVDATQELVGLDFIGNTHVLDLSSWFGLFKGPNLAI